VSLFVIGICLGLFMNEFRGMGERIEATQRVMEMMEMRRMSRWEERGRRTWRLESLFSLPLYLAVFFCQLRYMMSRCNELFNRFVGFMVSGIPEESQWIIGSLSNTLDLNYA
jgi:hypothetical protein